MQNNKTYEYTYTAPTETERKVTEEIRRRYQSQEAKENSFSRLKKLDQKVRNIPMVVALTFGIIGLLIFGGGMAIVLEKLFEHYLLIGIPLSAVGLVPIALAYPAYCKTAKKCKEKYGDEILRLSEEVLNGQTE